jgi:methionyl-tRNA formyltransferase
MRIVFIGTIDFSRHCLLEVLRNGGNVVAVITLPEVQARLHADFADLSIVARAHGIQVHQIEQPIGDPQNVQLVASLDPDVIFVFGWSQLVSRDLLQIPRLGCIGSHPTLLPKNRGRHPLIWTLVNGLKVSGMTFFYIDEGIDSGDILWQEPFKITLEDDASSLYWKIKKLATKGIREFLPRLMAGNAQRVKQDHSQATYWTKRSEKDGEINWSGPTMQNYDLIRALTRPYVGAHTFVRKERMLVWRAQLPHYSGNSRFEGRAIGEIIRRRGHLVDVKTGDGFLVLSDYTLKDPKLLKVGSILGG